MNITTLELYLAEHPFFQGLAPEYIKFITGCAANVRFDANQFIFRQNETADQFYVIRYGQVALETPAPSGGAITIQTLGEGEVLGWSWLMPPYKWQFDARAIELTRALALDGKCLRNKCEQDPRLGYELMKRFSGVAADRLQATRLQLLDLYGAPAKKDV